MKWLLTFFKRIFNWIFGGRPGYTGATQSSTSTIPTPQPEATPRKHSKWFIKHQRRMLRSHRFRDYHFGTFSPITPVGRGNNRTKVSPACCTRAFKDAFFRQYGVRLK